MAQLEKGQHRKLNVTREARHRVMCGLGWDPADKPKFLDKVKALTGKKDLHHDLDLACYTFAEDLSYLENISAEPGYASGAQDKVYHSGDNEDGYGEGDDEEISAELKDLPAEIHHIVFAALVRTYHTFNDIAAAHIRLADGYTNHDFLSTALNHEEGGEKTAFAFAHIYRDPQQDDAWKLHYIGEYTDYHGNIDSFAETLQDFLKT